jgi:hypothetical protein
MLRVVATKAAMAHLRLMGEEVGERMFEAVDK